MHKSSNAEKNKTLRRCIYSANKLKMPTVVGTDFYVYKQDKLHALLSRERFYNVESVFGMVCDKARLKPACSVTETS